MSIIKLHDTILCIQDYLQVEELHITGKSNITIPDLLKMKNLNKLYIEVPQSMSEDEALKMTLRVNNRWEKFNELGVIVEEDGIQKAHVWTKK